MEKQLTVIKLGGSLLTDKTKPYTYRKEILKALTLKQLHEWGCRYTELWMDKPVFDVLYDDRSRREIE